MLRHSTRLSPLALVLLAACSGSHGGGPESTGRASFAITNLPAGVRCIQITAAGDPSVVQFFPFGPGGGADTSALSLGGLPVGSVDFSGGAFDVDCAAAQATGPAGTGVVPTWVAPIVSTSINPGEVASVTLEFHPNGSASLGADFGGNALRTVTTVAGVPGTAGSADGPAKAADGGTAALFHRPHGLLVDDAGNVYVSDSGNHTIRKIAFAGGLGTVTTIAGSAGTPGSSDGPGASAQFNHPVGLALDAAQATLYVADYGNDTIRSIDLTAAPHTVKTLAGSPGVQAEDDGAGASAHFAGPRGLTFGPGGSLYVTDEFGFTVRQVALGGAAATVTTLAGQKNQAGHVDDPAGSTVGGSAQFVGPFGVAYNGANLFVSDGVTIRRVTPAGVVLTLAGDPATSGGADGVGASARFGGLDQIAFDGNVSIVIADQLGSTIRAMTDGAASTPWEVNTIAGSVGQYDSVDGFGADARFNFPGAVAVDPTSGTIYVADIVSNTIRALK
jgi:hypothetical protein